MSGIETSTTAAAAAAVVAADLVRPLPAGALAVAAATSTGLRG
jgi:hypothetical protein